jgi:hypothetical protein
MAMAEFLGVVRGYSEGDDGLVHLAIDEVNHAEDAVYVVNEMQRTFNPGSGNHGFGSRDVACKVKPGFASYKFALTRDEAKGILHGAQVRVRMDVYNVRKVIFSNRRWAPIPEVRYSLLGIRLESESRISDNRPEQNSTPEQGQRQGSKPGQNSK